MTGAGEPVLEVTPSQQEVLSWVYERWPHAADPRSRALKLAEEAGEVVGAVVKMGEGRKSKHDLGLETAQLVLCAMALAASAGFDLDEYVRLEWTTLQRRVW